MSGFSAHLSQKFTWGMDTLGWTLSGTTSLVHSTGLLHFSSRHLSGLWHYIIILLPNRRPSSGPKWAMQNCRYGIARNAHIAWGMGTYWEPQNAWRNIFNSVIHRATLRVGEWVCLLGLDRFMPLYTGQYSCYNTISVPSWYLVLERSDTELCFLTISKNI